MTKLIVIKKNYEFSRVFRKGKRYIATTLSINVLPRPRLKYNRVAYAVGRNYGSSVRRNRLKRLAREAYRKYAYSCSCGYDIIITMRATESLPEFRQVADDLHVLLVRADILREQGEPRPESCTAGGTT